MYNFLYSISFTVSSPFDFQFCWPV